MVSMLPYCDSHYCRPVGRVAAENILLIISNRLDQHSHQPHGPADIVAHRYLSVFFLRVED